MNIAAFILAVAKAVPAARDILVKVMDLYYMELDAADQGRVTQKARKRDACLAALKSKDLTDEQKNTIRRMLYDISRN